jgi:NADPH:quinone reductase-like Zn-dependent oxidoreductase
VAKSSFAACRPILEPSGTYVTTVPTPGFFSRVAVQSITGLFGQTQRASLVVSQQRGTDLVSLGELADQGKLKPTIGSTYPLDRVREAWQESQNGHTRGKIVLEL